MKKSLGTLLTVVVCGFIAWRALATWGYIGGALQPGGGGAATKRPLLDPAEVTRERVSGRWVRHPNPKGPDEILWMYPDGRFDWWACGDCQSPDSGTWEVRDGSIYLTRPGRTCRLGQVVDMHPLEPGQPPRWLNLMISSNGACEQYDRLESVPAGVSPPAAPQPMPPGVPPGLPVTEPKPLPTVGPKPLPTTGPK
jgi:hypothetical protein